MCLRTGFEEHASSPTRSCRPQLSPGFFVILVGVSRESACLLLLSDWWRAGLVSLVTIVVAAFLEGFRAEYLASAADPAALEDIKARVDAFFSYWQV